MSFSPSWATDFDKCTVQCLTDAIVDAGCSDLSDTDCFCKEDAQLSLYLNDSLYLCLGLTCDPYTVGSKNPVIPRAVYCTGASLRGDLRNLSADAPLGKPPYKT